MRTIIVSKKWICMQSAKTAMSFSIRLPHGTSSKVVQALIGSGVRVIDLSKGDFRYKDAAVYETWYGLKHEAAELLSQSVFGLPEVYRTKIKNTQLVGNPLYHLPYLRFIRCSKPA